MRDEEGRKKEASKVKQTTRQSNTAHPRQSLVHYAIQHVYTLYIHEPVVPKVCVLYCTDEV